MTERYYCTTCGIEIMDCGLCMNCIEIESGLAKYIKSENGLDFVLDALYNTGKIDNVIFVNPDGDWNVHTIKSYRM